MDIKNRISYDGAELTQILEAELDKLNTYRYDTKYRVLLGNRLIDKLDKWDIDIRRQKDIPLTLVVCGEFKRGKSSLINALLGEDVVTTNVTTETITTNRISYGAHENTMILSGGKRIKLSDEELACDKLREILNELGEKPSRLELKRPIEILKELTIIDTPGLGDSMDDFADDVALALNQADAVIYVFSVSYPLSVQEQLFIRTAVKPQKYTDLFLLGNYTDLLETEDECERIRQTITSRIADILPGEEPLMISALDERCRQMNSDVPNKELSAYVGENFGKFRSALDELLTNKRDSVIPDRIERMINSLIADVSGDILAISDGLELSVSDAQARVEQLRRNTEDYMEEQKQAIDRIDSIAGSLRVDAMSWMEDLIAKMQSDTDNLRDISSEDIKKYYSMFCIDTIYEAITRCNDYFLLSLTNELDDIAEGLSRDVSISNAASAPKLHIALQNKTWTSADTVSFYSNFLGFSSIPLISPVIDYIAGSARQKKIQKSAPDLISEIKAQYPTIKTSAVTALSKAYKDLAEKSKLQVSEYFEQQIAETKAQSEESAAAARQDENSKQEIRNALNEIRTVLNSICDKFVKLGEDTAVSAE